MFTETYARKAKIIVSIIVVLLLFLALGCNFWPFGQKNSGSEATRLKKSTDKLFVSVQSHAKEFDSFLNKLNKRWYTAKDANEFAGSLSTYQNQIKQDALNLKEVNSKLTSLAKLDKDNKFSTFISAKTQASESLEKVLANSQKIVEALNPEISNIARIYSEVDAVKQLQDRYMNALAAYAQRDSEDTLSKSLVASTNTTTSTETDNTSATNDSSTTTDTTTTDTTTPDTTTPDTSAGDTASGDSGTGQSDSVNTSSLDRWVYRIAANEWPSPYMKDLSKEIGDNFNSKYQELYALNKVVNFKNSATLVNYLQQAKEDVADLSSSIEALEDNLKEQKRLEKLKEQEEKILASENSIHSNMTLLEQNRPAGVSSDSLASKGVSSVHQLSHEEIDSYEKKIIKIESRITELRAAYKGSLTTDYEEATWRFGGSLMALYRLDMGISRKLMHETKNWKRKAISKYVYRRLEHLAEAKYQNHKANKAYTEAKDKIASK